MKIDEIGAISPEMKLKSRHLCPGVPLRLSPSSLLAAVMIFPAFLEGLGADAAGATLRHDVGVVMPQEPHHLSSLQPHWNMVNPHANAVLCLQEPPRDPLGVTRPTPIPSRW